MSKIFQNYLINVDFLNQKELLIYNFNQIFINIRKKLHIKHSRKSEVDSLLKKAKCKFFQTVHKIMKYCLNITINRLPQEFITNITIEYNINYLEKTILQIYSDFNLIQNLEGIDDKIIKIKNKELFKIFTKYKYYELYKEYTESQCYKKDINNVINKNGKNIGILYEFVSKNFIFYYMNNKNKLTKLDENKNKKSRSYSNYNKKNYSKKIKDEEEIMYIFED